MWYSTGYQTKKKQGKSYNVSALMTKTLLYHQKNSAYLGDVCKQNWLLVFQCFNMLNRQAEQSGPQVISYLMGWGDIFCSHQYVPVYWSALKHALKKSHPTLEKAQVVVDNEDEEGIEQSEMNNHVSHFIFKQCIRFSYQQTGVH